MKIEDLYVGCELYNPLLDIKIVCTGIMPKTVFKTHRSDEWIAYYRKADNKNIIGFCLFEELQEDEFYIELGEGKTQEQVEKYALKIANREQLFDWMLNLSSGKGCQVVAIFLHGAVIGYRDKMSGTEFRFEYIRKEATS